MELLFLCTTVLLVTLCFPVIPMIPWKQRISYAVTLFSISLLKVQVSQPYSAIEVTSDLVNFSLVDAETMLVFRSLVSFASSL